MKDDVEIALIVSIPPTITGLGAFILGLLNRRKLERVEIQGQKIEVNVDGHLSKLMEIQQDLARAQGRREGVDASK